MRPESVGHHPDLSFEPRETAPQPPGGSKRILVADDDGMVRSALVAVLESEGYELEVAGSGRETVARVSENPPDLVLLDLGMPDGDGWHAFAQLDRRSPLLPVIVMTALPHQYQVATRLGVDAFMEKPLNIPVLLRAIRQLTNETTAQHVRRITDRGFLTRRLETKLDEA
jgi:CheY-like chemotaxis protein